MFTQRCALKFAFLTMPIAALPILFGCNLLSQVADSTDGTACGDLRCEAGETEANCPADCLEPDAVACAEDGAECPDGQVCVEGQCVESVCGDGRCDADESSQGCPEDCNPADCGQGCATDVDCADSDPCTNDTCTAGTGACEGLMVCENAAVQCPQGQTCANGECVSENPDGELVCGNGRCDVGETSGNCPDDCPDDSPIGCGQGCATDAHCDDANPCSVDRCIPGTGFCAGLMICDNAPVQCPEGQVCSQGECISP